MFILVRNWQLEAKKAGNNVGNYIEGHSGRLLGILFAVNRNKVQQVSLFAQRQGRKVDLNSVKFHQARKEICSYANKFPSLRFRRELFLTREGVKEESRCEHPSKTLHVPLPFRVLETPLKYFRESVEKE